MTEDDKVTLRAIQGAYRHIDEHGHAQQIPDSAMGQMIGNSERAQREEALPTLRELQAGILTTQQEIVKELRLVRKALVRLAFHFSPEPTPKPANKPEEEKLLDMLRRVRVHVRQLR